MIEITVKTLDSKNHNFSVADDMTVRQLKEHIVDSVNIPAESQRLIYCGRVLQDEKNLSEYDVNGKVVHLVQRAPPDNNARGQYFFPGSSTDTSGSQGTPRHTIFGPAGHAGNAMYVGAMAFPAEIMDASGISMQQPRQCLSRSRLSLVRTLLRRANFNLSVLERPIQDHPEIPPQIGSQTQDALTDEDGNSDSGIEATIEISPGSFIIDNQQIDVGGPSVEIQTESVSEQSTSAPEAESDPQSATTSDQQPPRNNYQEARNRSRYPRTRALADLLDQVRSINTRVQPYMTRFLQLMRDDPACPDQRAVLTNQTLFTGVSELMHNLAHAYHALSDIMCDFSQQPPRFLTCRPVLIHHSAVVQTGIPIQVSSSTSAGSSSQPSSNGNSARSAPSTATGCEEPPTTQASDAPQTSATSQPSSSSQTSASSQPPSEEATPSGETTPSGDATPSTQPSASNATNPDDPADRQPRSPSTSPPRVARIGGSGVPGFEIFVDVAPGSITIDSLEATVVGNAPPNTAEPNTWQNPPEFLQNFVSALAGQFMGATLQQYRFPEQQSTGTNTQQTTAASTQSAAGVSQPSQNSQARSNTATHPTTATQTRSTARPHVHLSPSIHGLRTNTSYDPFLPCNSHHIRYCRNSHHRAPQGQANSGTNTTPEGPRVVPMPAPSSISISLRADPVINREQRPSRSTGIQPVQNIFASLPQELQMLFQTIRAPNAYGGQTPTTLAQLLQDVPGYSFTLGESIFTDIFMTLAQSLTFMDMVQLGLGSSECLIRARPQLQQMVSERLLNGEPLTISGITNIIDRFNDELRPYFNLFDNARLREEVDLPASVNLYNHTMIPIILNTLMEEEDQSTFHRTLLRKCALYVHQLCALVQYCCLDGVTGLERILGTFVSQMTTGLPSVLQEWTLSHSVINFRTFIGSLNVPIDDIKRYLVYRIGNDPTATSSQPAATQPQPPPVTEPMETDDSDVEIVEPPTLPPNEPSSTDDPPLDSINEEEIAWRNTLPSDWVPIISRDSQRQRRQSPQGPFSDAYLSGMPSKRRKLITSAKPQGNLSQVISESMATALGAAGMSSGPEVEVIAQRAGQDSSLRTAYREQVRTTLHHKLSNNTDFTPDKYPNTAKYFKKP